MKEVRTGERRRPFLLGESQVHWWVTAQPAFLPPQSSTVREPFAVTRAHLNFFVRIAANRV